MSAFISFCCLHAAAVNAAYLRLSLTWFLFRNRLEVSRPISTIDVVTDPSTGAIVGFRELPVDAVQEDLATPDRSMAINRQPGSLEGKIPATLPN